jgi:hypothetical protein
MTLISLLTFALLYPVLKRRSHPLTRAVDLYLAFLASLVLYGVYLWVMVRDGTVMMIPLALLAGHSFDVPLLVGIWFVNTALSRTCLVTRRSSTRARRCPLGTSLLTQYSV